MADFCKQCSVELFGEDLKDLAWDRGKPLGPDQGWAEICEGCGYTLVKDDGECISPYCTQKHGRPPDAGHV